VEIVEETTHMIRKVGALTFGLAFLLAPLTADPLPAQEEPWGPILAEFSQQIAADVETDDLGGITAGVVVGRDLIWARGFGWADRERGIPAGVNTIYRVGSISKSFTAVILLELWQQGVVDLDAPVREVLPELSELGGRPPGAMEITWRHLASHTAGLIREPDLEGAAEGPLERWEEKILSSIPATSYYAPPGESYRYSNIGFGILGYALGRVAGIPFMELVDASLIRPLDLHSTGFVVTPAMAEHLARGYERRRDGVVDTETPFQEHVGRGYKVPNGGIYSTVGELGRFTSLLTAASTIPLLGPEARRLVETPQTPEGSETRYSFGFFLYEGEGGETLVGHSGSVAGYNAFLVFEPGSGIGVVLLRNYGGGQTNLGEAGRELLNRLLAARLREEG
jgi:CubicO group peptidase (beta-lactamase class C family)